MDANSIVYMTPKEVGAIDPSQITSMTMTSGDV